jgi:hypothetical protein
MVSAVEGNGNALGFDAHDPFTVERAPGTLTFFTSNGEVTAADNARSLKSMTRAFDFLGVARVELQLAKAAISLAELHRDDAAASALDETLDKGSLVGSSEDGCHGKKKREALASLNEQ